MADVHQEDADDYRDSHLRGTTFRVYRYMLRKGRPLGISDVQKGLKLSSPSVSQYHIEKLLRLGLIKEEKEGYVVDKIVIENVIRISRISVPVQTAYVVFFAATLLLLLSVFRPSAIDSVYFFAVVINVSALLISLLEMRKTLKRL